MIKRTGVAGLLGGAGVGLALFGASFLIAPKERIVTLPGTVTERTIEKQVPGPERIIEKPVYVTRAERDFISRPEFETAQFKGRLIEDPDGLIRFDSGSVFVPTRYDPLSGHMVQDHDALYETKPYWGDWAFCNSIPGGEHLFKCLAIDHDAVVDLATTHRMKGRAT